MSTLVGDTPGTGVSGPGKGFNLSFSTPPAALRPFRSRTSRDPCPVKSRDGKGLWVEVVTVKNQLDPFMS